MVRRIGWLTVFAILALSAPSAASAQDVAGTWVLSVALDAGSGDATFVFQVEDNQITGSYTGTLGEQTVAGTVEGSTVKFGFSVDQVGDVTFEGTIDGTSMSGTCNYGALGAGTFSGSKS